MVDYLVGFIQLNESSQQITDSVRVAQKVPALSMSPLQTLKFIFSLHASEGQTQMASPNMRKAAGYGSQNNTSAV